MKICALSGGDAFREDLLPDSVAIQSRLNLQGLNRLLKDRISLLLDLLLLASSLPPPPPPSSATKTTIMQTMYSSLFSAGLVQLWDADQSPAFDEADAPATSNANLTSFLSFDDSRTTRRPRTAARKQQPRRRRSDDADDFRTFVHDAGSSSPSRSVSLYLPLCPPSHLSTELN